MSRLSDKHEEKVLQTVIKDLLLEGSDPDTDDVDDGVANFQINTPLEEKEFKASDFKVTENTSSSAELYNDSNKVIQKDMQVLQRELLEVSDDSQQSFDRWRSRFSEISTQLDRLKCRVRDLLLITQDTDGHFGFLVDEFAEATQVDVEASSNNIIVDLGRENVTLEPSNTSSTKIDLNELLDADISFAVLTQKDLQSSSEAEGSLLTNAFSDLTRFWQHRVFKTKPGPVVSELKVKISDTSLNISRVDVRLHTANTNSSVQITPLYSADGINFFQLPIDSFSQSVVNKATFSFEPVKATHFKFIFAKDGFDVIDEKLSYVYEFGVDDITFYSESFTDGATGTLYSDFLSVTNQQTGDPSLFSRASLEVCEELPTDTDINYFLAATDDNTLAASGLNWITIDPLTRTNPEESLIAKFADPIEFEFGNTTTSGDWVLPAYDSTVSGIISNPSAEFTQISISGVTTNESVLTSSGIRFALPDNDYVLLDHQLNLDVDEAADLKVFRNTGVPSETNLIRNIQAGWGFSEPYYLSTIDIKNSQGLIVDFGDSPVILDDSFKKGEVTIEQGQHTIKVHKDNWLHVGSLTTSTVEGLKAIDPLYPFNHKMIVEGYSYPSDFVGEEVYAGADIFAEFLLKRVSCLDILRSVRLDDLSKYGIGLDAGEDDITASNAIIVRTDSSNPDFINERFIIRFEVDVGDAEYKYIRFRADLITNNDAVSPALDSYKIKVAK